jgi:hypothetical protein
MQQIAQVDMNWPRRTVMTPFGRFGPRKGLKQSGKDWKFLEKTGRKTEKTGKDWKSLEKPGKAWKRTEKPNVVCIQKLKTTLCRTSDLPEGNCRVFMFSRILIPSTGF